TPKRHYTNNTELRSTQILRNIRTYDITDSHITRHDSKKVTTRSATRHSSDHGDDNPSLSATVTGTVNGDTLNYTLATTALKFSKIGDYPITTTLSNTPHYDATKTDGNLHISKKAATVTADDKRKTYGDDTTSL